MQTINVPAIPTPNTSPDQYPLVSRIYTTKGQEFFELYPNTTCDKRIGLVINDKIHWLKETFGHTKSLASVLKPRQPEDDDTEVGSYFGLKLNVDEKGRWVNVRGKTLWITEKTTVIRHSEATIFQPNSFYMRNAIPVRPDDYFWTVAEIQAAYYS